MIFLCFSGRDRMTIVQSVLYNLKQYGINLWYNNYQYILGDNKIIGYEKAIRTSKYAIVIIGLDFENSHGALEELAIIKQQYIKKEMHIFPIFYNRKASSLPSQYQWLSDLIYNELDTSTGSLLTCNQILCKILEDYIDNKKYDSIETLIKENKICSAYLVKLIELYAKIVPENYNARICILQCIIIYIKEKIELPKIIRYSLKRFIDITSLGLSYNFKEEIILKYMACISINLFINKIDS